MMGEQIRFYGTRDTLRVISYQTENHEFTAEHIEKTSWNQLSNNDWVPKRDDTRLYVMSGIQIILGHNFTQCIIFHIYLTLVVPDTAVPEYNRFNMSRHGNR